MMSQPRHSHYNAIAYTLEQTDRILIQMSFAFRIRSAIIIFKEKSVVDEEDLPEMQDIDKPYILSQNQGLPEDIKTDFIATAILNIYIMKTCLYNFGARKPNFCIVKLGFTGV